MMNINNLEGKRFGKLIVSKYAGGSKWVCQCECGNETIVFKTNLVSGKTQSCGCKRRLTNKSKDALYNRYMQMKHKAGCEWTYEQFLDWIAEQAPTRRYRITRIDKTLPFSAANCILK